MRAAILEQSGQPLSIVDDLEIEDPRPGQVRVRVKHCGVCHSDLSIASGVFPSPVPVVLGHEAAGVVDAVGDGVDSLAVGDPVVLTPCPPCGTCYWCVRGEASLCVESEGIMTNSFRDGTTGLSRGGQLVWRGVNVGAFAEYVVTRASGAVKIPEDVPLELACVIGCAVQTGAGAVLNTARVEEGASVLVMGLGGIGLSSVQGARIAGASTIIASDPLPERREAAKTFGATHAFDPTADDVVARTHEITGVGADYAFETAGVASLIQTGIQATRKGGTVVAVGAPAITEAIEIAPAAVFAITEKKLVGSLLGSCNSLHEIPRLLRLWQAGRLDLEGLVTARRPLAEVNEAMADLAAGAGSEPS